MGAVCIIDWQPADQDGQNIRDRTFEFACAVVEFCKMVSAAGGPARLMVAELLGCSNSAAAMLEEARAAESKRDFISKCSVGLKEAREAHVRLRVCHRTGLGPPETALALIQEANQIISIITAIVRNTRRNVHTRLPAGKRPFASRNS